MLSPWILRDYTAHWDRVLETMLRLKLNLLDVGEFSDDSLRKLRVPRDRGLAVTTTHLAPFGASLRDWADYWKKQGRSTPPPLRLADMPLLEQFWEHHIKLAQKEKVEMIWMIGLRGDGDKGFYKTFVDAPPDDVSRAKVIEDVLHKQVALLQRVTGQPQPLMRTLIYDEASDYMAAGLLHPPELPNLIWNFSAARHDHFPAPDLRRYRAPVERPLGYYFNIQFTNTGSHLADGEGPWKMEQNHRMLLESGPADGRVARVYPDDGHIAAKNEREWGPASWAWLRGVLPVGLATGADVGLSNLSLIYVSLSFYVMCKSRRVCLQPTLR
jgi:hypothetical protein